MGSFLLEFLLPRHPAMAAAPPTIWFRPFTAFT
jgi:hypothetical protein